MEVAPLLKKRVLYQRKETKISPLLANQNTFLKDLTSQHRNPNHRV